MRADWKKLTFCLVLSKETNRKGLESLAKELRRIGSKCDLVESHLLSPTNVMRVNYVLDRFEGPAHDLLAAMNPARYFGPQFVWWCIKNNTSILDFKTPLISNYMRGVHATSSGIEREARVLLHHKIQLMGGSVSRELTTAINTLVMDSSSSEKYKGALKANIPIVLSSWVDYFWNCSEASDCNVLEAIDKKFMEFYALPPFKDCVISVTGFEIEVRERIEKLVIKNGGEYSKTFEARCTHLVALEPKGSKYEYATKFAIPVVSLRWLEDCCEKKGRLEERNYLVGACLHPRSGPSNAILAKEAKVGTPSSKSPFLAGFTIYLHNIDEAREALLKKIIHVCRGVRVTSILTQMSCVVVTAGVMMEGLGDLKVKCPIVSHEWLLDCCLQNKKLPFDAYDLHAIAEKAKKEKAQLNALSNERHEAPEDPMDAAAIVNLVDEDWVPTLPPKIGGEQLVPASPFVGKKFALLGSHLKPAEYQQVKGWISKGGGTLSTSKYDFAVASHVCTALPPIGAGALLVTPCWIQACSYYSLLVPVDTCFLFSPVVYMSPFPIDELKEQTVFLHGFDILMQNLLRDFCEHIGFVVDPKLSKKTNFLLALKAQGDKVQKALEWNIPVVTSAWLFECAQTHSLVSPPVFTSHSSSVALQPQKEKETLHSTESSRKDALVPHSPAFGRVSAEAGLLKTPSPSTRNSTASSNTHLPGHTTTTPTHIAGKDPTFQTDEILAALKTPQIKSNLEHEGLMKGVIVGFSSKILPNQIAELSRAVTSLGGEVRTHGLTEDCTHLVHSSSSPKAFNMLKDVKLAKKRDMYIVSPSWISRCVEVRERVPEEDFPYSFNPSLSIPISASPKIPGMSASQPEPMIRSAPIVNHRSKILPTMKPNNIFNNESVSGHPDSRQAPLSKNPNQDQILQWSKTITSPNQQPEVHEDNQLQAMSDGHAPKSQVPGEGLGGPMTSPKSQRHSNRPPTNSSSVGDQYRPLGVHVQIAQSFADPQNSSHGIHEPPNPLLDSPSNQGHNTESTYDEQLELEKELQVNMRDQAVDDEEVTRANTESEVEREQDYEVLAEMGKKIDALIASTKPVPAFGRKSINSQLRSKSSASPLLHTTQYVPLRTRSRSNGTPSSESRTTPVRGIQDEDSCEALSQFAVTYGDPGKLRRASLISKIQNQGNDIVEEAAVAVDGPHKIFLFSGLSQQEKEEYTKVVQDLGGEVLDSPHFDNECTHVVVGAPSRSEKYLAACAAGKWILQKSYLDECHQFGDFASVREIDHEWPSYPNDTKMDRKLSSAASFWRAKLQSEDQPNKGAFFSWRVVLFVDAGKQDGFLRLIEAGAGTVLSFTPPFSDVNDTVTHVIIEQKKLDDALAKEQVTPAMLSALYAAGGPKLPFLTPEYVGEYIMSAEPPQCEKFRVKLPTLPLDSSLGYKRSLSHEDSPSKRRKSQSKN